MQSKTVGIYHVFEMNRSAIINELASDEMNFQCEEITSYEHMKEAHSDVVVIFSPEFLPSGMKVEDVKRTLLELNKTVIIVAYEVMTWTMDRNRTFYLHQRDDRATMNDVRNVLVMELIVRTKHIVGS